VLWHLDGSTRLSQHRAGDAGGAAPPGLVPDRAAGPEPGPGGTSGRRPSPDREHVGEALPRAGRGGRPRRPASVAPARQRTADCGGGRPSPGLDQRRDARSAGPAVRLVDQPGGARADRAALRQALGSDRRAGLPAALGHEPAEAAGAGQGALSGRDRSLAGAGLSGDRRARQSGRRRDLLGR